MINTNISNDILIKAAKQYGTPCLCYSKSEIDKWAEKLQSAIPKFANIMYSVKASPNPFLIKYYNKIGFYFETASEGELRHILNCGVKPEKIWISGQGKSKDYLLYALNRGISHFNIESIHELDILAKILKNQENIYCNIRVNPNFTNKESILKMGGCSSAFGVDEDDIIYILHSKYGSLINGLFIYAGSQYFKAEDIIKNTKYCFSFAKRIFDATGLKIKSLDLGGGFGVPETETNAELDIIELQYGLQKIFETYLKMPCFSFLDNILFESGRYLSARTAYLLTRIVDIKTSKHMKYVIINGGINCLGIKQSEYRLYPPFIKHIKQNTKQSENIYIPYQIVGTTCTPIDLVHPNCMLKDVQIGDFIAIPDCGAYSVQFSPKNFNGQLSIPEIIYDEDKFILTQKRGEPNFPFGIPEKFDLGSGNEISMLLKNIYPMRNNVIKDIAIIISIIKIKNTKVLIYDTEKDGVQTILLLKILLQHNILPIAVYTEFKDIKKYTHASCFSITEFDKERRKDIFVLMVGKDMYKYKNIYTKYVNVYQISSIFIEQEKDFHYYLSHESELQILYNTLVDYNSKQCFIEYIRTILENDYWKVQENTLLSKYWGYDEYKEDSFYIHLSNEYYLNIGENSEIDVLHFLENGYSFSHIYMTVFSHSISSFFKNVIKIIESDQNEQKVSILYQKFGCYQNQISIDNYFINKKITLITIDVEGKEFNIIKSAIKIIVRNRPVVAISVHIKYRILYSFIKYINKIVEGYNFYLRKYPKCYYENQIKETIVLYAVPNERRVDKELL